MSIFRRLRLLAGPLVVVSLSLEVCLVSCRNKLTFLADTEGYMNFVDRMFKMSSLSFQAYDGCVLYCQQMKQQDVLLTVGHDKAAMNVLKA